jgi:hypothetical protein
MSTKPMLVILMLAKPMSTILMFSIFMLGIPRLAKPMLVYSYVGYT